MKLDPPSLPSPEVLPAPLPVGLRSVRIAVCEDSHITRHYLVAGLGLAGFQAEGVEDGFALDRLLARWSPDIVILDIELPGEDGFTIASRLRRTHPQMGVIMLTARGQLDDRIKGLDSGADAYFAKPVEIRELTAVIGSLHRRVSAPVPVPAVSSWHLQHPASRLVTPRGRQIGLTDTELRFLDCLLARPGHVVDRDEILKTLDQPLDTYAVRRMETMLSRLRAKVARECPEEPLPVKARQNRGYIFLVEEG